MGATRITVEIKILDPALHEFGGPPRFGSDQAAACDLVALSVFATTPDNKPDLKVPPSPIKGSLKLRPGILEYVGVGFAMDVGDSGYAAHVVPRSSSAALGIALGNTVGLIDADYQGPLLVALWNRNFATDWEITDAYGPGYDTDERSMDFDRSRGVVEIARGERIAQMYLAPIVRPEWKVVDEFSRITARAAGGFGSTGRR
jgi:dUTP pyrophosphatase